MRRLKKRKTRKIVDSILNRIKVWKKNEKEGKQRMRTEKEIEKAALVISERVMDEWYGGEEFPEDCQLFEEILCGLLQDNPEECEKLIGTAFCEEEEVKDD